MSNISIKRKIRYTVALLSIAAFILTITHVELYNMKQSCSWPARQGVIACSEAVYHKNARSANSGGGGLWVHRFEGHFEDTNRPFKVRREDYGTIKQGVKDGARARAAAYPVGSSVTVYVNPADETDIVLDISPDTQGMERLQLLGYIILGLAIAFPFIPRRRKA